jgi:polyhydroxyalkanoate synthesis regulator phasin
VAERSPEEQIKGLSDSLRDAIERTFAATAGSASETRERAGELLDEVARRGEGAREAVGDARRKVVQRGQEARDAPRALADRIVEAIRGVKGTGEEEVAALREEVAELRHRLAELERRNRATGPLDRAKSKPKPKG